MVVPGNGVALSKNIKTKMATISPLNKINIFIVHYGSLNTPFGGETDCPWSKNVPFGQRKFFQFYFMVGLHKCGN